MRVKQIFCICGTDTGVGKTALTVLLTQFLRTLGINVGALKPISSGGRADACALQAVLGGALTLDEINPWHFRPPLAPVLAARRERKCVTLADVLVHIRTMQKRFDILLVEGAGGLLSPLGEGFNSRDLLTALRAMPVIVCPNRLGAVNQALLTLEALPKNFRARARVLLVSPSKPDVSTDINAKLLAEFFYAKRIFRLPRLGKIFEARRVIRNAAVRHTLRTLLQI